MKNIYTYVAKEGYAARVQDTKSYDAIRFVFANIPALLLDMLSHLLSARTYYQDGRFLWYPITITQVRTRMNTGEETYIFPGTTPLSYHGTIDRVVK